MQVGTTSVNAMLKATAPEQDLILAFRFAVFIFAEGSEPNAVDIRFQKVSGISAEVTTTTLEEGGQNLYAHKLPERVSFQPLVLERGLVTQSPVGKEFDEAMSRNLTPGQTIVFPILDAATPDT